MYLHTTWGKGGFHRSEGERDKQTIKDIERDVGTEERDEQREGRIYVYVCVTGRVEGTKTK